MYTGAWHCREHCRVVVPQGVTHPSRAGGVWHPDKVAHSSFSLIFFSYFGGIQQRVTPVGADEDDLGLEVTSPELPLLEH